MKRSSWMVAVYLLLVFSSGIAVGGFSHYLYTVKSVSAKAPQTPDGQRNRYVDELRTLLKLSAEQVAELNEILDVTRQQYRTFREKHKPEMKAIQDEQVEKIRAILDAGQKATYQQRQQERSRQDRSR